jgi:WD40 repeat protein
MAAAGTAGPGADLFFYNTTDHDGYPMWTYNGAVTWDSIAISADGEYIVAVNGDGPGQQAILFNKSLPEPGNSKLPVWRVDPFSGAYSVDISADGKYIVVGGSNEVRVYNNSYRPGFDKTNEYLWTNNTANNVNSVAISADGNYVAAGTDAGGADNVIFWNNSDYDYNQEHPPMWSYDTGNNIDAVAISVTGEYIAVGSFLDFYLFNKSNVGIKTPQYQHNTGTDWIRSVAISEDGEYIAVGADNSGVLGAVSLYINSESKREWYNATEGEVRSVDITADGNYIVAGTEYDRQDDSPDENTVFLYNRSGKDAHPPEWAFNTSHDVNSMSISAWGNYIGVGGEFISGSGRAYLFYHARPPPPRIISGNGDDDDDHDDEEAAIPFGNHYLLFTTIAVVSLVIITKRKLVFSKK